MTELHGYWTPGFTKLYEAALNADPAFQKATKSFKGTFLFRAMDTPWGTDAETTYEVDHGTVVASPSVRPAPWVEMRNAPFDKHAHFARATAPFAIWAKLDRGEMNVLGALASPDYHIEGPKLKIARAIPVLNAMSAVSARLPKRYA
ncbi:MAG: hypothetical protein KC543_17955 [Myxococcales bacterium]|nr:hypothetical protein [Myxococcales bacterium]